VRADEEPLVGDKGGAVTKRRLPDGVSEHDGRDGRPSGSDALTDPSDATTREPDQLNKTSRLTADPARHVLEHGSTVLTSPVFDT
jgi:hypothetical protein